MNRIAAIVILVLGVALVIAGVTKILPGAVGGGGGLCLLGLVMLGLSFISVKPSGASEEPPLSTTEQLGGIFYEPARVFRNLRAHPRWVAAFLVIALASVAYQVAFTQRLGAETIATATMDKVVEGPFIPQDRKEEIRAQGIEAAKLPGTRLSGPINAVVGLFIFMCIFAALYMLGVLISGARIKFWQAFSVAVFAALPPVLLQHIISLIILFVKSPDEIDPIKGQRGLAHADLGLLFAPADHPYLYVTGSLIGLFTIYGLWLTATGLHNAGEKVSKGTGWFVALALWFIGLLFALGAAALFPAFVT
ncbi:MAG: YIP1 family protein [Pyrinomonadaceae bacterium]